ncbi:MAG TPA: DUF2249 domain-containing protein [Rhodocyclaceae bacterium]|nr:DUF2249 domain-containing protein [Rhodocyclaceae bacterium]
MDGELLVDARYLEPPEPFVRVMEALDTFDRDPTLDEVRLLIFREPFPLYKVLDQHRYVRQTTLEPDGTFVIVIRRPPAG